MKIKCPHCSTSYEIKAEALGPEGRSVKCAKCGNRWFVSSEDEEDLEPISKAGTDKTSNDTAADAAGADRDEADWAADAREETLDTGPDEDLDGEEEPEAFSPTFTAPETAADEDRFAADMESEQDEDDSGVESDIESHAKRPKIVVNPDKFRKDQIGAVMRWLARRNYKRVGGLALFGAALAVCTVLVLMRNDIVKQSPDLASLFRLVGLDVNLRGLEFRNLRTFTEDESGKTVLVVEGSIRNLLEEPNTVPAVRLSIRNAGSQEIYAWTVEPRTQSLNGLDETRFRTILADPPNESSDIQVRFVDRGRRQVVLE
ncbi:zinc-ribbon domain-containing protein [Roseibium aggregatum]|uniref:Zinc-ribbon domain-containing protein n=1 Tax=Roseibium aggregatum TaxID=187304 RepID=A0A939EJ40_9HYPH|nr:zinc-ribbon domain-containing protein [Roseibium aggregatum]MBN9673238.1 zinc-ribbon domain-containing protein [Roseibium aggregatum]